MNTSQVTCLLPVKDLSRARRFYEDKLRMQPMGLKADGKFVYRCGGAEIALFPKAEGTKAEHTGLKTVEHVCVLGSEKAAWFQDTEGNILCLHEDL